MLSNKRARVLHRLAAVVLIVAATGSEPLFPQNSVTFQYFSMNLYVKDLRKSIDFYAALGFDFRYYVIGNAQKVTVLSPTDPEPYAAHFRAGDQSIGLMRTADLENLDRRAHYLFEVTDPAAYYSLLMEKGVTVGNVIRNKKGEVFFFSVEDPDKHKFFFRGPMGHK